MEPTTATRDDCQTSPYPFNFSSLREGCLDPVLGKKVKWLIASDDNYIVYVDEDNYVEWTMNDNGLLKDCGPLLNRVAALEAVDNEHLEPEQIETFKRLVGESVARMFEGDRTGAGTALDSAEKWISARCQETARSFSLRGATATLAALTIAFAAVLVYFRFVWDALPAFYEHRKEILITGAYLGSVGAWLSILQRSGGTWMDSTAAARLYEIEGRVRVLIGGLGGLFVALLLKSGDIMPTARPAMFLAVCMLAGLSERLVTTLAGALESRVAPPRPAPAAPAPPVPAPARPAPPPAPAHAAAAAGNNP